MDRFDFVVIGAGAAGEAAANMARQRGATVAVIDRDLVGGSCSFWACIPSKSLLHSAAVHHGGGDYPWPRASDRRDYNINREGIDYPDDVFHTTRLTDVGAVVVRGTARLDGPGRVIVRHDDVEHEFEAGNVVVAVGSESRIPDLPGLNEIAYWTNREGTSARELPESLLILGGGTDRRGAGPGLRPVRGAGDHRRVRTPGSWPATTPATPRSSRRPSNGGRDGADRCPRGARPPRRREQRPPRGGAG